MWNYDLMMYCSLGAEWTGLFCALCSVCDQMNTEQELDVFQTVKIVQKSRPQFIQTLVSSVNVNII